MSSIFRHSRLRSRSFLTGIGSCAVALLVLTSCAKDKKIVLNQERTLAFDYFHAGEALETRGQFGQALEEYRKALDLSPRPAFAFAIGELKHRMGEQEEAIRYYDMALTDSSDFEKAQARKSQAELELAGNLDPDMTSFQTISSETETASASPNAARPSLAGIRPGSSAFESRDEAEIIETLFPELDPDRKNDPAVLREAAGAAIAQQRFSDAVAPLEELSRVDSSPGVAIDFARALYYSGQKNRSFQTLESALNRHPGDEGLYLQLGRLLAIDDQWERADDVISQGLESNPDSRSLFLNRAALRIDQGKFSEAVALLDQLLSRNPEDFVTSYNMVIALVGEGTDLARAREITHDLSARFPGRDDQVNDLLEIIPSEY